MNEGAHRHAEGVGRVQQDVLGLQIAVHDVLCSQSSQCNKDLRGNPADDAGRHAAIQLAPDVLQHAMNRFMSCSEVPKLNAVAQLFAAAPHIS